MKRSTIAALVACTATAVIPAAQAHLLTSDRTDSSSSAAKVSVTESTLEAMLKAGVSFHATRGSLKLHSGLRPDDRPGIRGV